MTSLKKLSKVSKTMGLVAAVCLTGRAAMAFEFEEGWNWKAWADIGGILGSSAHLTEFAGPVTGQQLKLSPGVQMDLGLGYRPCPWLVVGPEIGFTFNTVDAFGDFWYPDTTLFQMPIMAQVTLEYPHAGRLVPYIGGGVGGLASLLTFGNNGEWDPDGTGSDFVFGFQAMAGLRYRISEHTSLGVAYRYMWTDAQNWNVEWWDHSRFRVGIDPLQLHSFCLVFSSSF